MSHKHTHYVFPGGRGSTKSSFTSIMVILILIANPLCHAVCFRKIANTIQNSIFPQIVWAIYELGLEQWFKIPKTYSSPIVYLPTGQRIMFMGVDDPNKVKSIKLPFGYIGVTWFEELDSYAGENEIRTILQSTMRGGSLFWDFRTFNPPISKNNWANEYAESCEIRRKDSTLVTRNTYLDVPADWLGEQFIAEAEELKEVNPRAYEHEYMGIATGTGGDVFPNVSELDMSQGVKLQDAYGNTIKTVPLYRTFDRIYHGIDWGFARDPFRFVKMHYDKKKQNLFIYREYSTLKTLNREIYDKIYNVLHLCTNNDLVIADSAEPKSIADFRSYGAFIRPVSKYAESVRDGIKWLQGRANIFIDKVHCPETWEEFNTYEYETDRDGNFISAYPDKNNHCLIGSTKVDTPNGQIAIEKLVGTSGKLYAYDLSKKQKIIADYTNCRQTFESADIWEIELENGKVIECTYDHPFLTSNRGYVMACKLTKEDDIVCI